MYEISPAPPRSSSPSKPKTTSPPSRSRSPRPRAPGGCRQLTADFSLLTPKETALRLNSSLRHGLTLSEANTRILDYGTNELPHAESEPLWKRFLKQFQETLILLLLGSAAASLLLGNTSDAFSIAFAVFLVTTVGFVQEYRSEKSLEALNSLVPHFAHIIRGGASSTKKENGDIELDTLDTEELNASHGAAATIPAADLVPGDLVLFHTGDRIPADIRITQAADLTIDESNLTGENEAVSKTPDQLVRSTQHQRNVSAVETPFYASEATGTVGADMRLHDQCNIAFMGTLVCSGYGQGLVIGTGTNTEFGAISASLQDIESPRTPLQEAMGQLGKELSYVSFAVIGFISIVGLLRGWKVLDMFQIGVSLAVAAIPEGLPVIVTVTLALGVLRMSNKNAIVRRLPSVETLGSVNVVCSDKTGMKRSISRSLINTNHHTGTLTTNHMTVTKIWHFDGQGPIEIARKQGMLTLDPATRTILRIGNIVNHGRLIDGHNNNSSSQVLSSMLNEDTSSTKSRWAGQPTDVALLDLIDSFEEEDVRPRVGTRLFETPFSSERKWMGVVIKGSDSTGSSIAYIKGAVEKVLKRCDTYITSDGREVVLDEARRQEVQQAADSMAQEGLRVLGFASGFVKEPQSSTKNNRLTTPLQSPLKAEGPSNEAIYGGLAFAGLVGMNDPPRKGVDRSIRRLMAGGVKVIMITGDAENTAVAIGRKLGMPIAQSSLGHSILRGEQLDAMTEEELSQAISTTTIFARTSPEHKLKIVKALQARGDVVAMTGDGVNDAPALKKADIGISMGKLGTDVAKEAADMILTDDDFSTILNAIEEGKGIFYNIQNFLTFQLSTSAAALSLVLLATCLGFKNPLNAMQILWISWSPFWILFFLDH